MYLVEWIQWASLSKSMEWWSKVAPGIEKDTTDLGKPTNAAELAENKARMAAERYGEARAPSPVYACNDTYLEVRCGALESHRGLITLCSLGGVYGILGCLDVVLMAAEIPENGIRDFGWWLFWVGTLEITAVAIYLYCKYIIPITRLESLTSRHLLIRFNRVTRQVYLHRPSYCGGIVTLPWEGVLHDTLVPDPLLLWWEIQDGEHGFPPSLIYVGKPTPSVKEQRAQWEYIRRYMDEGGLRAVERPGITSQFPWPWQAFTPQLEGLGRFLNDAGPGMWLACLLISPAFLVLGLSHWASLLLCWKPRWPKIIQEAGESGKPVPKLSCIDDYPPEVAEVLKSRSYLWMAVSGDTEKKPKRPGRPRVKRLLKNIIPEAETDEKD